MRTITQQEFAELWTLANPGKLFMLCGIWEHITYLNGKEVKREEVEFPRYFGNHLEFIAMDEL